MQRLASMFRALGDETRLRIMGLLVLHDAGLVENRRPGKWMCYRVPDAPDARCLAILREWAGGPRDPGSLRSHRRRLRTCRRGDRHVLATRLILGRRMPRQMAVRRFPRGCRRIDSTNMRGRDDVFGRQNNAR